MSERRSLDAELNQNDRVAVCGARLQSDRGCIPTSCAGGTPHHYRKP